MKLSGIRVLIVLLGLSSAVPAAETVPAGDETRKSSSSDVPTAELMDIIAGVAKRTGRKFVVNPRVRTSVPLTGLDPQRIDYPTLLAILRVNQFATYESGGVITVDHDANSRQFPIPVSTSVSAKTLDDELVTVLVNVKHICAPHIVPILRPLMPQNAHLAAMTATNSVLISDRADNTRRILDLVERLEKQAAALKQDCTESSGKSSN